MIDLSSALQNEYKDISYNVEPCEIVSVYNRHRRRKAFSVSGATACMLFIMAVFVQLNPKAFESAVMSTGNFLNDLFSGSDSVEYIQPPSTAIEPAINTSGAEINTTDAPETDTLSKTDGENTVTALNSDATDPQEPSESAAVPPKSSSSEPTEEEKNDKTEETTESATTAPTSKNKAVSKKVSTARIKYIKISKDTIKIIKCIPTENKVVIPQTIDGYTVTAIDEGILKGYYDVEEVVLPDTVTKIGDNTFSGLKALKTINIPKSIKMIGASAFENCASITSINLREVETIGDRAFMGCESLITIKIPDTVKTVGTKAFAECEGLETAVIASDCDNKVRADNYTFADCDNLKRLTISEGVSTVQPYQFYHCRKLSRVVLPSTLNTVSNSAFEGCASLKSIELPRGLKTIGQRAFYGCEGITSVTIWHNVRTLGDMCFGYYDGNKKLSSFTVKGYDGTSARKYAEDNGFVFESVGRAGEKTTITLEARIAVLNVGDTYKIEYSVDYPNGETTFASSDDTVAEADNTGTITALKSGKAIIDITNNGVTKQFVVVVK